MRKVPSLVVLLLVAACVPRVAAPPARRPAPPAPIAIEAPAVLAPDWRDWPVTPGDWVYRQDARGSISLFGPAGQDADFTIRCDKAARQVYLSRKGAAPIGASNMTILTTSTKRALPSRPTGGTPAYMASALFPSDPLLDAMGYSRGRFVVEQPGLPVLVIPAWPEILRVTEDCRA